MNKVGVWDYIVEDQKGAGGVYVRCRKEWLGLRHLLEEGGLYEIKEVRLILNEHALSLALQSQSVLGLCEMCSVSEEGVGAVEVHYACALHVDTYDRFRLE